MSAGFAELIRGAGRLANLFAGDGDAAPGSGVSLGETPRGMLPEPSAAFQLLLEDELRVIEAPAALADAACALIAAELRAATVSLIQAHGTFQSGIVRGAWPLADRADDERMHPQALDPALAEGLVAGLCVQSVDPDAAGLAASPVMAGGRLVAVVLATTQGSRRWQAGELALLRRAGERSWAAFGRAQASADLRRSEYEHRMAVALCPQTFWTASPDGRLDDSGPLFGQLARHRSDQRDMGWRRTTHPDDLPDMERVVAQCLRTGEDYDIEHRTLGDDGRPRWIHVQAKAARGPDGRVQRWFGTITDIDRRKRAEAALKASEDRFLRAISGARVGTWDWDMGTDEVVTSPGFEPQFHDLPEGSIRSSRDFLDAIHPDDRDRMETVLADVVASARRYGSAEYEAEYRVIRGDGEVRWLGAQGNVTVSPGDGHGGFLSGLTVDMSERRRAEEMLAATQDRLHVLNADLEAQVRREVEMREHAQSLLAQSRRMEALGQLAGGIAHDFNNVLQAVVGGLDLLQRRADRPDLVRQLAARTAEAAARGTAITGRLLAFARRGELSAQPVAIVPLLDGLREMLAPTLGVGIALDVAAASDLPPLLADRGQLETVLVNLAVNARDAMPQGGRLSIQAEAASVMAGASPPPDMPGGLAEGFYIRLAVRDDGIGMDEATLSRASEPFFTTKPVGQGTGLGLAMARGFVEQSGGGLALESAPGRGTTVWLWFPAAGQSLTPEAIIARDGARDGPAPPRILVVDDDGIVRSSLASVIADLGYAVIEAAGGEDALARLDGAADIALVVTDYAMPRMTGTTLAARIRQTHPSLPVLLVTGHVEESLRVDTVSWESPITMLVRKPVTAATLSSAIATLLAGKPP